MKKSMLIALIFVISVWLLLSVFYISCRKQTLDLTMTGYRAASEEGTVEVRVDGVLSYRFFRPYRFRGRISVEGYELTFDEAYTNDILLQNGCGFLDYMRIDEEGVRDEFLGHIRMDGSGSLLILLYGESHAGGNAYICAPAGTEAEAALLAEKLSQGTWMEGINWNKSGD
ncbi:MAG: hypothetical protein KH382_04920 [Clostridiales bacterium]|nr:hypothetical protein [Clostridiales bacterium]